MSRWQPWDIIDGSYADDTRPWSSQEAVNYLLVPAEQGGTLSSKKLVGVPGLIEFCDLGTNSPVRGTWNAEGTFLAVSGNTLFKVAPDGTKITIGTVPGVGRVCFAHNKLASGAHQVVIANVSSGYVYNTGDNSFVQITDPAFPGAVNVGFVDGYIAFNDPFGRFWGTSDLQNALSYNSLDRYDAESQPDPILGVAVSHREVNAFGTRTGEFFRNTGAQTGTFQRVDGAETEVGIANAYSWALLDNTVYWLGNDGLVYRYVNGHLPQIVSNGPIATLISERNIAEAFAFTWEDRKHKVFYLTFPDGETIGYDVWTDRWHRRQSYGMERWRINTLTKFQGNDWIAGDFTNGKLYRLDWNVHHEAGKPLVARRRFPVAADGGNALLVNAIKLMFNTGQGSSIPELGLSGNFPNGVYLDSGTFQYTTSGGIAPITFSLASGSLPPGAVLNEATGQVAYTFTGTGTFNWTVRATDAFGQTAELPDSSTVTAVFAGKWALFSGADNSRMWLSDSPSDWSAAALTRTVPALCQPWPAYGDGALVLPVVASENVNRAANQTPTTTVVTTNVDTDSVGNRVWFEGGLMFKGHETDTDNTYAVSQDGGATWTKYPSPVAGNLVGIGRYNNGRWVAHFNRLSVQQAWYSDEAVPVNWTFGFSFPGSVAWDLCCDGVTAIVVGTLAAHRSTNGITWTTSAYPIAPNYPAFMMFSGETGVFIGYSDNDNRLCRSIDGGATWTQTAIPPPPGGARGLAFADYHNGVWAVTFTYQLSAPGLAFTSTDNCATLTPVTLPAAITGATTPTIKFLG
ncbi:packaged DNA stabilization protein [Lysobacter soli]|uniref:packaged DNA stabilization protein n=1 Tax=Lysobacter soli TaxID=453783 RepID=UPI0037CA5E46